MLFSVGEILSLISVLWSSWPVVGFLPGDIWVKFSISRSLWMSLCHSQTVG